jgi:hypothetical protein
VQKLREYIKAELRQEFLLEFDADQLIKFHLTKMDNIDKDGIYYEGRMKDGKKIEVRFGTQTSEPFGNGDYDVTFYVDNSPDAVINSGTPFSTVASVIKVIEDFCEKVKPKALVWLASKTSKDDWNKPGQRDLLYKRFLSRQVPTGYKFLEGGWGGGVLERVNQNEPDWVWPGAAPYLAPPQEKLKDPFADFDFNDPEMIKEIKTISDTISDDVDVDYFDPDNEEGDEYEFQDLGYTAVYGSDGAHSSWTISEYDSDRAKNYEVGILWWDGDLEVLDTKTLDWNTHRDIGTDLKQAVRYIWLQHKNSNKESLGEGNTKDEEQTHWYFPELNHMAVTYRKMRISERWDFRENTDKGQQAILVHDIGDSVYNFKIIGNRPTEDASRFVMDDGKVDIENLARYMYLITRSPNLA